MERSKRVIYTEAGQARHDQLLHEIRSKVDAALLERKFVPGLEVVEITGSDVDDLARSMNVVFRDRYDQRLKTRAFVVNLYLFVGTLTILAGVFYPDLHYILRDPVQLTLVASGAVMVLAALLLRVSLESRRGVVDRERELIRSIEETGRKGKDVDA